MKNNRTNIVKVEYKNPLVGIPLPIMRALVEIFYDFQGQRIATFNNVLMNSARNGITEEDLDKKYGVKPLIDEAKKFEDKIKKRLDLEVVHYPLYENYLKHIQGIGSILSSGIIANIGDISKFDTISKLWMYAGLGFNKFCPECKCPTYVNIEYENSEGNITKGKKLKPFDNCLECNHKTIPIIQKRTKGYSGNWNPRLKVLCWKIGSSFVKQKAAKSGYRRLYESFRKDDMEFHPEKIKENGKTKYNDGHMYNRAVRKTIKIFLSHLWMTWRELQGLEVRPPYVVKVLGHDIIKPFKDR